MTTPSVTVTSVSAVTYATLQLAPITTTLLDNTGIFYPTAGMWTVGGDTEAYNTAAVPSGYTETTGTDITSAISGGSDIIYTCNTLGDQTEPTGTDITGLTMAWPNTGPTSTSFTDGLNATGATWVVGVATTSLLTANTNATGGTSNVNGTSIDQLTPWTVSGWTGSIAAGFNYLANGNTITFTDNTAGNGATEPTLDITGCILGWSNTGATSTDFVDGVNATTATFNLAIPSPSSTIGGTWTVDGISQTYNAAFAGSTNWEATGGDPPNYSTNITLLAKTAGSSPTEPTWDLSTLITNNGSYADGTINFVDSVDGTTPVYPDSGSFNINGEGWEVNSTTSFASTWEGSGWGGTSLSISADAVGAFGTAPTLSASGNTLGASTAPSGFAIPLPFGSGSSFSDGTNVAYVSNSSITPSFTPGVDATYAEYVFKIAAASPIQNSVAPPDGGTWSAGGTTWGPNDTGVGGGSANWNINYSVTTIVTGIQTYVTMTQQTTGSIGSPPTLDFSGLTISNAGNQLWTSTPTFTDGLDATYATYTFVIKAASPLTSSTAFPDGGTWSDGAGTTWEQGATGIGAGSANWSINNSLGNVVFGNSTNLTMTQQTAGSIGSPPTLDFSGLTISNTTNQLWNPQATWTNGAAVWTIEVVGNGGSWNLDFPDEPVTYAWNATANTVYENSTFDVSSVTLNADPSASDKIYTLTMASPGGDDETVMADVGTLTFTGGNSAIAFFMLLV